MITRAGWAVRCGGDPQIAGALAEGIRRAMGETGATEATGTPVRPFGPPPHCGGEAMGEAESDVDPVKLEADEIARAWVDRQRLSRTVGNRKTAEDYARMLTKARGDYGHNPTGPIRDKLWVLVGLLVLAAAKFMAWEETAWKER